MPLSVYSLGPQAVSYTHLEHKIKEGNYVLEDGTVIGRHKGITHYTIGQRKGLNLATVSYTHLEFIAYLHNTKGTSKNTEVSYERDLRKMEQFLRSEGAVSYTHLM